MITRIEIDGFKTFRNFSLELAPLQVIVGLNGAGKSNLFDACTCWPNWPATPIYARPSSSCAAKRGNSSPSNRMDNGPTGCT